MGSTSIDVLALGPNDAYYWQNSIRGEVYDCIPDGLRKTFKSTDSKVENVNLGPGGEWFVRFKDGHWSSVGGTSRLSQLIDEIHIDGASVQEILFGHRHTWVMRYNG